MGELNQNKEEKTRKNRYYLCEFSYEDFEVFYRCSGMNQMPGSGKAALPFFMEVFGAEEKTTRLKGFEYFTDSTQTKKVKCKIDSYRDKKTYHYDFTFLWGECTDGDWNRWVEREIYKKSLTSSGKDIVSRILCTQNELCALLILCLAIRWNITEYTLKNCNESIPLCWKTAKDFQHTAAILEKMLLLKKGKDQSKLIFKEYLNDETVDLSLHEHLLKWATNGAGKSVISKRGWECQIDASVEAELQTLKKTNDKLSELNERIADEIFRKANRFPLLSDILAIKIGNDDQVINVINLLKQLCRIDVQQVMSGGRGRMQLRADSFVKVDVRIEPIIDSAFRQFNCVYDPFLAKEVRSYTKQDVRLFLAYLARKLSDVPEHSCGEKQLTKYCKTYSRENAIVFDTIKEIRADVERFGFIIQRNGQYKFQHKELRLVFLGIYEGNCENERIKEENSESKKDPAEKAVHLLAINKENELYNSQTTEHFNWKFDNSSIFGCVFLNTLTHQKRKTILEELCRIAGDASVRNRRMQEKAIALLSYYLVEASEMTGIQREEIFRAAYSRDMYSIQENLWEYLSESCPFYKKTVAESLERACTFDEKRQYARQDPNYIFLGWDREPPKKDRRRFLRESCKFQHQSWFGNSERGWDYEEVFRSIGTAAEKLEEDNKNDVLYYVYGLNLLLLALSNIRLRHSDAHFRMEKEVENRITENHDLLMKAAVLCDFMTRKYNRVYNDCGCGTWKTDLFLLSGGIRFLCVYNDLLAFSKVPMSTEMLEAYNRWYASESGRWKVLMTRLLSHTDFFEKTDAEYIGEEEYRTEDFLEYDHLPETYDEFVNSIKNESDESA